MKNLQLLWDLRQLTGAQTARSQQLLEMSIIKLLYLSTHYYSLLLSIAYQAQIS